MKSKDDSNDPRFDPAPKPKDLTHEFDQDAEYLDRKGSGPITILALSLLAIAVAVGTYLLLR